MSPIRHALIATVAGVVSLGCSCSAWQKSISNSAANCVEQPDSTAKPLADSIVNQPSDSVSAFCLDSIHAFINRASEVTLLKMQNLILKDAERDNLLTDSILSFPIEHIVGNVTDNQLSVLKFILTDHHLLSSIDNPIRQPYCPSFALEFKSDGDTVKYLVSFNTNEALIIDFHNQISSYSINFTRDLCRWILAYFPEDSFYVNYLKYQYNEKI